MQARIHVITLAVQDLDRALAFYRDGLGLSSPATTRSRPEPSRRLSCTVG